MASICSFNWTAYRRLIACRSASVDFWSRIARAAGRLSLREINARGEEEAEDAAPDSADGVLLDEGEELFVGNAHGFFAGGGGGGHFQT